MGVKIDFIEHFPVELQENILRMLSERINKDYPVEIDDIVYFVEKPVAKLVEKLTEDCIGYKKEVEKISRVVKN